MSDEKPAPDLFYIGINQHSAGAYWWDAFTGRMLWHNLYDPFLKPGGGSGGAASSRTVKHNPTAWTSSPGQGGAGDPDTKD